MYLIVYDICEKKRLKKVSAILNRYGRRVQKSVYECGIDDSRYRVLREKLHAIGRAGDRIDAYHLPKGYSAEPVHPECAGHLSPLRGK